MPPFLKKKKVTLLSRPKNPGITMHRSVLRGSLCVDALSLQWL